MEVSPEDHRWPEFRFGGRSHLVPIQRVLLARLRFPVCRAAVWYGGLLQDPERASRAGQSCFIRWLVFTHDVAPVFGPYPFSPPVRFDRFLAEKMSRIQSGRLNFYLALIGPCPR